LYDVVSCPYHPHRIVTVAPGSAQEPRRRESGADPCLETLHSFDLVADINNSFFLPQHPLNLNKPITDAIMGGETVETEKPKSTYPKLSAHPVGQWIPNIYKDRIGMFYSGGQYEKKNLRA
jgi:hypothetical protein